MFFKPNLAKRRKEKLEESRIELERAELIIEEWTSQREMLKSRIERLAVAVAEDDAAEAARQSARRPHFPGGGLVPALRPSSPPPRPVAVDTAEPVAVNMN